MKKNVLKKALAVLVILAMMVPFMPVIASAESAEVDYTATYVADDSWYGDGSAEEFTINSVEQLASFMSKTDNFAGKTIKLGCDLYWNKGIASKDGFVPDASQNGKVYVWTTVNTTFEGTFDGQGNAIYGLYMIGAANGTGGFLKAIKNAVIKDISFKNGYLSHTVTGWSATVGFIASQAWGNATFTNVSVDAYIISGATNTANTNRAAVGGFLGEAASKTAANIEFTNCTMSGLVSAPSAYVVGGFMGNGMYYYDADTQEVTNVITMTDCINYATVECAKHGAGLVARVAGSAEFTRCASFGKVTQTATDDAWSASLVVMQRRNGATWVNGLDGGNGATSEDQCVSEVSFIDCYHNPNANQNAAIVSTANSNKESGFKITVDDNAATYHYNGNLPAGGNNATWATTITDKFNNVSVADIDNDIMTIEGVQTRANATDNTKFDARFVASIDLDAVNPALTKEDVKLIGFQVAKLKEFAANGSSALKTKTCAEAYTSIASDFGNVILKGATPEENDIVVDADYLTTLVLTGIPATGSFTVLVRAYYETANETFYGGYVAVTFVDGAVTASAYLSEYEEASQVLASSYLTDTFDLAPLLPDGASDISIKASKGQTVNGTTVLLNVGRNFFDVTYLLGGEETTETIAIARRSGHRVVFNSNGGSYIAPQSVADGGKLTNATPTRVGGYEFLGWFRQDSTLFDFSNDTVTNDMMLVAHWQAPSTPAATNTKDAFAYDTSSAAINIVWKDYANAFFARPASMTCTLSDGTDSYKVVVTENNASFVNGAPAGAMISTGAGNWTVKISGLDGTKNYTFTADDLNSNIYEKQQSGTAVTYTINGYNPMLDDSAWLMTQNGRLYDYAGNVVVLKGVVTYNVGWNGFEDNVSLAALTRLQSEGVNCIRLTVFVENASSNIGYHLAKDGTQQTETVRAELRRQIKVAIDNASSLGMYCIVDWGILASIEMTPAVNATAKELFVTLATEYKDNPYVIYEICNEPAPDTWGSTVVPYAQDVIAAIREQSNALVILAPDAAATNLSEHSNPGDDPIDKPLDTALSYSVAYTYHCYAASHKYNATSGTYYGWKIKDALDAGLTLVLTEFSPAVATMSSSSLTIDEAEANKFLNVILNYDMSFMLFRYMSGSDTKDSAQYMFKPNHTDDLNNGTWTCDMLQNSGKWFYDNALDSNGFIKAADFSD